MGSKEDQGITDLDPVKKMTAIRAGSCERAHCERRDLPWRRTKLIPRLKAVKVSKTSF